MKREHKNKKNNQPKPFKKQKWERRLPELLREVPTGWNMLCKETGEMKGRLQIGQHWRDETDPTAPELRCDESRRYA